MGSLAKYTRWTPGSAAVIKCRSRIFPPARAILEIVENERLRYTDKFDDPNLPGEMETTVEIKPVSVGTELNIVQTGIPEMIPAEACYLGWQESLKLLAMLVEAEIPDE